MSWCSNVMLLMSPALTNKENQLLLYSQKVISQFYDRLSFFERYSFIKAWTSECIDFVIKLARRANESLTSMLNSNKISLSKVGIVNRRFVSTKFFKSQEDLSVSHDNFILPIHHICNLNKFSYDGKGSAQIYLVKYIISSGVAGVSMNDRFVHSVILSILR